MGEFGLGEKSRPPRFHGATAFALANCTRWEVAWLLAPPGAETLGGGKVQNVCSKHVSNGNKTLGCHPFLLVG